MNSILSSGNFLDNIETAKKVAECVSNIISPCSKGNNSVQQIVLTGILNSEVKEPSSSINNLHHKGVMTGDIVEYFGFNDEEVKWLLDQSFTGLTETEESALFEKLKYWYNGQIIGSQNTGVFTPSSVMRYIGELRDFKNSDLASKTPDFKCYWSSTENVSILRNFAKIAHEKKYQEVLDKLVKISYNQTVEYNHSPDDQLYTILDLGLNSSSNFERLVFYYLSRSGYITKTAKENMYKLPAREVQKSFKEQVQDYWLQKIVFKTNWDAFENVAEEVDFCDDNLPTSLSKAMNLVSKDYENFNEDTFKCILHSIFSMSKKRDEASISIEPHTGKGYIDMVLYFHKKALIFELKFNNDTQSDRIDRILSDELYQILDKGYLKLVLSKLDEKDKSDIQEIRLISLLLYRIGTNAEWLCKKQEIKLEREAAVTVREFLDKFGIKEKLNSEAGSKLKKEFLEIISDSDKERLSNKLNQLAVEIQDGQAPRQGKASKRKGGAISHDYGESDQSILRYRSAELDRVLRIRMSDERVNHNDVVVIDTHKKYEYPNTTANVGDLLQKIEAQLSLRGKDRETLILVPYAYHDHFIGLAFVVGGDIVMNYLDPENQELDDDFLAEMNKSGIKINKIKVGQQKYNNCGIEVIENFIGFLKKENLQKRSISQEKAIAIHQRLSMEFRAELSENTKRIKGSMDSLCNDVLGNLCTNFVLLNSTDNIRNDNSLLDNLQQHFLIFYQATQRDNHKILLPILEGDRWSIALIEIKAIPQTIVIKSFGNRALSQGMQSSLKDLLQAAIYGVMEDNDLWKPRTRMLGMDGKSVQTKRYILDYGIEVEDKFDDRIKSAEELVAHVYHEVTGRDQSSRSGFDRTEIHNASSRLVGFSPATTTQPSMFFGNQQSATNMIYPEKQANSNSRGQSTAASRLSFFGNQNNRQTDDNPAARMDIEKRLHPPLNSIFSEPKSNNLFETSQQSNKSLMKESIGTSEQKGFSGDFFGPRDNKSAYNFF